WKKPATPEAVKPDTPKPLSDCPNTPVPLPLVPRTPTAAPFPNWPGTLLAPKTAPPLAVFSTTSEGLLPAPVTDIAGPKPVAVFSTCNASCASALAVIRDGPCATTPAPVVLLKKPPGPETLTPTTPVPLSACPNTPGPVPLVPLTPIPVPLPYCPGRLL